MRSALLILTSLASFATIALAEASSLWLSRANSENGMYAARIARRPGDILTVNVAENTAISQSTTKTTNSTSVVNNAITNFAFMGSSSGLGKHNGVLPSANLNSDDTYVGGGTVSTTNNISATVTVVVSDVLPNGNMVVEGARKIQGSGETQYAIFRGVVRSDDVTAGNTVESSRIANAHLEFMTQGEIANSQKKGMLTKLLDFFNVW